MIFVQLLQFHHHIISCRDAPKPRLSLIKVAIHEVESLIYHNMSYIFSSLDKRKIRAFLQCNRATQHKADSYVHFAH